MDGITMGGGFGVAGACNMRVATEKTIFAMPEVGIGFFPDVGSVHTLTRCPQRAGYWLGLTGSSIGAADMLPLGIATHYMASNQFAAALEQMIEVEDPSVLDQMSETPDHIPARIFSFLSEIDKLFDASSVEHIFENLDEAGTVFAQETAKIMRTRSPTSLKLTFAYLRRMQHKDFDAVTAMDYRLAIRSMRGHEFYEGIRAALIDKDKTPHWKPAILEKVDDRVIENYFGDDLPDLDTIH
jgi:enoyl-CoA hydratase